MRVLFAIFFLTSLVQCFARSIEVIKASDFQKPLDKWSNSQVIILALTVTAILIVGLISPTSAIIVTGLILFGFVMPNRYIIIDHDASRIEFT